MADLIEVVDGIPSSKQKGVELLKQGLAPRILFTGQPPMYQYTIWNQTLQAGLDSEYESYGVLPDQRVYPPFLASNTWQEGDAVAAVMKENNWTSLICITEKFHIPRSSLIFSKDMPKYQITWFSVPYNANLHEQIKEILGYISTMFGRT